MPSTFIAEISFFSASESVIPFSIAKRRAASNSVINCANSGNISGYSLVGGIALIAGEKTPILIENCRNSGDIQLNYQDIEIDYSCVAGIVCEVTYGEIKKCIMRETY